MINIISYYINNGNNDNFDYRKLYTVYTKVFIHIIVM